MGFIINPYRFPFVWATGTGGTLTTVGDYKVHKFTSSGSFVVTSSGNIEYLVIGGGGGGANDSFQYRWSGGGGAGGFRTNVVGATSGGNSLAESSYSVSSQTYTITVGAGGAGGSGSMYTVRGSRGSDSSIIPNTTGTSIISLGGGGGGAHMTSPPYNSGASTTGEGGSGAGGDAGIGSNGRLGTTGQGFNGANIGGGGGASRVGYDPALDTNNAVGYSGGEGLSSSISGTVVKYAGGGGGGQYNQVTWLGNQEYGSPIRGALFGGGIANIHAVGGAGTANTGGGGGSTALSTGGAGGSGIVIIRYKFQNLP